jgi:hypothetical protein
MPLELNDFSVRESFEPRPGCVFIEADVEALEMVTLAQVEIWLLKDYRKAKQINSGADLHCVTGVTIASGLNYREFYRAAKGEDPETHEPCAVDPIAANQRNLSKVPNFGKPGGMADRTLVGFARTSYGIKLGATPDNPRPSRAISEAVAEHIGACWRKANPNDQDYLDAMRSTRRGDGLYHVVIGHPSVGAVIKRGRASYCAACNSPFQGLGALASGDITFEIQRACYALPKSPLYGCRLVIHAYDSWLLECPRERVTEAAAELTRIIESVGRRKIPDVIVRAPAAASVAWAKTTKRVVHHNSGELLVWGTPECDEYLESKKKKAA